MSLSLFKCNNFSVDRQFSSISLALSLLCLRLLRMREKKWERERERERERESVYDQSLLCAKRLRGASELSHCQWLSSRVLSSSASLWTKNLSEERTGEKQAKCNRIREAKFPLIIRTEAGHTCITRPIADKETSSKTPDAAAMRWEYKSLTRSSSSSSSSLQVQGICQCISQVKRGNQSLSLSLSLSFSLLLSSSLFTLPSLLLVLSLSLASLFSFCQSQSTPALYSRIALRW